MRKTNTTTWVDFLAPPPPYFWAKTRHYIQYSKVCFSSDKSTNPGGRDDYRTITQQQIRYKNNNNNNININEYESISS